MWAKVWRVTILIARIFAVAFAVIVPIGIFLQESGHLRFSKNFEATVWVIGLIVIGVDNLGTLISRKVHDSRRTRNAKLDEILMHLLVAIGKAKRSRLEELGASVWVKKPIQPLSHWRGGETVLRRIRRFRPMNYPHQSHVTWTSRMGLVGECWTNARRCYRNLWALSDKYDEESLEALTAESFAKLGATSQNGFTFQEFKATAGKYSEVVATPIFSTGPKPTLLGVLSIDRGMPELGDGEQFQPALDNARVREDIQVIVELIGRLLSKSDEQGRM